MVRDSFASFEDDLSSWGSDEEVAVPAAPQNTVLVSEPEKVKLIEPPKPLTDVSELDEFFSEPEPEVSSSDSTEVVDDESEETTGPIEYRSALLNKLNTGRWVADFSMACASIGATVAFTGIPPVTAIWVWFAGAITNNPNYVPLVAALPYLIVTVVPVLLGVIALITSFSYSAKERSWKFRKTLRWMSLFSIGAGALLMVLVMSGAFPIFGAGT